MAVTVSSKIKGILSAQKTNQALGVDAVQSLLEEVRKQIVGELATSPSGYSALHMRQLLSGIEKYLGDFESAADRELATRISSSFDTGAELLPAALKTADQSGVYFGMGHLSSHLVTSLQDFTFGRISAVTNDAYAKIKGEVILGILGQKSPQEVAAVIAGNLEGPSIFKSIAERAEVITQTEMGRAFSMATQSSIETASNSVEGLKKMWLHAGHPRAPRQLHLALHGSTREINNPFYQSDDGTPVMYPRDPGAPIKEVIRCGCTHIPYMENWGSAKDFAADFDATAHRVDKPKEDHNG